MTTQTRPQTLPGNPELEHFFPALPILLTLMVTIPVLWLLNWPTASGALTVLLGVWIVIATYNGFRYVSKYQQELRNHLDALAQDYHKRFDAAATKFDAERAERAAAYAATVAAAEAAIERAAAPRHPVADPDAIADRLRELDSTLDISTAVATDGAVTVVVRRKEQPALP